MASVDNLNDAAMRNYITSTYNAPNVVCSCGSRIFHEAVILKKVSGLVTGSGKEELVPIPVYVCDKCGKIPEEFTSKPGASKILGEDVEEKKEESSVLIK